MNLARLGEESIQRYGEYTSLAFEGRQYTNVEQHRAGARLANALRRLGVDTGDRVVVMLPNCPEVMQSYSAIVRAGGVIVPVIFLLGAEEVGHILAHSEAKVVITLTDMLWKVEGQIGRVPSLQHVLVVVGGGSGASPLPPVTSGQRIALIRLKEGPLFLASFTDTDSIPGAGEPPRMTIKDATGQKRPVRGLYAALSYDEGETWPVRRLITDDGPGRWLVGGAWTGRFQMSRDLAEPRGYLSVTQTPDRMIHLISSALHYEFNLAWVEARMPGR